ncbi:hypothetical protein XFEB_01457 [Xylella fastidiosa EB92.1]|nr:hypothetical protein XFEB_01457 [Xylella fastidiosa EB92.1]
MPLQGRSTCTTPKHIGQRVQRVADLSKHAVAIETLPSLHKHPFRRSGITLFTADARVSEYPGPIQRV